MSEKNRYFAGDVIEAAKLNKCFDKKNAQEISEYHNIAIQIVMEEIVFVRKRLAFIIGE